MKTMLWIATLVVLSACGSSTDPDVNMDGAIVTTPIEFTLRYGDERQVEGTVLRVGFAAVLDDSRCPQDVTCVWQGNAEVVLGLTIGMGPTVALHLNTGLEPGAAEWSGMLVTLVELTPVPLAGVSIPKTDYQVKLRVEPLP